MNVTSTDIPHANLLYTPRVEFASRFSALYAAGGSPPLRLLASAARTRAESVQGRGAARSISAQRISDWKAGRNAPSRFETLLPVLLVLIDGARRRGRASRVELVNLRGWNQLWRQAQPQRSARSDAEPTDTSHFPGSEPYSRAHAPWFTGRGSAIEQLVRSVNGAANAAGAGRIVILTGATGVGKSSLLAAGLTPALEELGPWSVRTVVADVDPAPALHAVLSDLESGHDAAHHVLDHARAETVVVIDQFERVLTDPDTGPATAMALLRRLVEFAVVLISVRSPQLTDCASSTFLHEATQNRTYSLAPMRADELRTVVTELERSHGTKVEAGLADVVTAEIGGIRNDTTRLGHEPAELAILSQTLRAMSEQSAVARFSIDGYRRINGVRGVVHTMADKFWDQLPDDRRTIAQRILLGLVAVRDDIDDTRRRVSFAELRRTLGPDPAATAVLRALVDSRLISMDRDTAYLGHDLLLTWRRLTDWIEAERPVLLARGHANVQCGHID
ncbi:ATP-binding protein [Nocardia salmonicida]|uniref:ATP-binding protein n=1 Tax=Nocardia salmonicida TaxID=53431 RepID=UPI003671FC8B